MSPPVWAVGLVFPLCSVGLALLVLWDCRRHPPTPHERYLDELEERRFRELRGH